MKAYRLPLLALALVACAGTAERRTAGRGTDEQVVDEFIAGFGRRPASALLRLFTDDAVLRIEGLKIELRGRPELRRFVEYGSAVDSRMRVVDMSQEGEEVQARFSEENEWFSLLGVSQVYYRGRFRMARNKITSATMQLEAESRDALADRLAGFLVWLAENEPQARQRILPGGMLVPDAGTFRDALQLLRRWRSGVR